MMEEGDSDGCFNSKPPARPIRAKSQAQKDAAAAQQKRSRAAKKTEKQNTAAEKQKTAAEHVGGITTLVRPPPPPPQALKRKAEDAQEARALSAPKSDVLSMFPAPPR